MWIIESFSEQTDEHLYNTSIDYVAAHAVERLLGEYPSEPSPEQVRVIAPLFDLDPSLWDYVTKPTTDDQDPVLGWLEMALLYLLSKEVGGDPLDRFGYVFPIPQDRAQTLLRRFSPDAAAPPGELFIACQQLLSLAQAKALLKPFAWGRDLVLANVSDPE